MNWTTHPYHLASDCGRYTIARNMLRPGVLTYVAFRTGKPPENIGVQRDIPADDPAARRAAVETLKHACEADSCQTPPS